MRVLESLKEKYLQSLSYKEDANMIWAKQQSELLNKSGISLNAYEAYLLYFFIKTHKCEKVVEVGTLTGYSSLWIHKALPQNGSLWTLEKDPNHALIARQSFAKIQGAKIELIEGDAIESLKALENEAPFDAVFIDGNKSAYLKYLDWAEKNLKTGGVLLADNTLLRGGVYNDNKSETPFSPKQITIMQEFNRRLAIGNQFESLLLPTDEGFSVAIKI
jgi:predicted O-methyltransferase YrrM